MQLWEVLLIFIGIPAGVCLLITAIVFALTSSNEKPEGRNGNDAQRSGGPAPDEDGDGLAGDGALPEGAAAASAVPHARADESALRSSPSQETVKPPAGD